MKGVVHHLKLSDFREIIGLGNDMSNAETETDADKFVVL